MPLHYQSILAIARWVKAQCYNPPNPNFLSHMVAKTLESAGFDSRSITQTTGEVERMKLDVENLQFIP